MEYLSSALLDYQVLVIEEVRCHRASPDQLPLPGSVQKPLPTRGFSRQISV